MKNDKFVNLRLPADLLEQLKKLAADDNRTLSNYIRWVLWQRTAAAASHHPSFAETSALARRIGQERNARSS